MWGREVIEKGSRRRIGSGESIDVVKDRWLPKLSNFKVSAPPFLPNNIKVVDLYDSNGD